MEHTSELLVDGVTLSYGGDGIYPLHGLLFRPDNYTILQPDSNTNVSDTFHTISGTATQTLEDICSRLELFGYTLPHSFTMTRDLDISSEDLQEVLQLDIDDTTYARLHSDLKHIPDDDLISEMSRYLRRGEPSEDDLDVFHVLHRLTPLFAHLRILGANSDLAKKQVTWNFKVTVGMSFDRGQPWNSLGLPRRFLVVTEGSSDAKVIAHAIKLLRPELADLFSFVDMGKGYPFSGTGEQHKFTQGLISISYENRVIILYDNDTAGREKFEASKELEIPTNMEVLHLPDCDSLRSFGAKGPSGVLYEDINGKAAAIECYLDLTWKQKNEAFVRWSSFKEGMGQYQGALERKGSYTKAFLKMKVLDSDYDTVRLESLLNSLVEACVAIGVRHPQETEFPISF